MSDRLARILAVCSEDTFNSIARRSRPTHNNQQYEPRQTLLTLQILKSNEQNSEGRDDEMAYFIETLRHNTSFKDLSLSRNDLLDETLSRVILALVGHQKLERLNLNGNAWFDQATLAHCSLFDSDSCMLSELSFGDQYSPLRKNNVGPLAAAIARYKRLQILGLSKNSLDKHDLVTLRVTRHT